MSLKIIIGIILGFAIAFASLNTDNENDYSSANLGIVGIASLFFIGSSFGYD